MFQTANWPQKQIKQIGSSFALALLTISISLGASEADSDGCWSGKASDGGSCVELKSEYDGSRQKIAISNRCRDRLVVAWCGQDECGTEALRGGQRISRYVYSSGNRAKVYAVGSKKPSNDDVCQQRNALW